MFPLARTPKLAQRALGAMRVARSFLLLEDDYDVDWEVGQDEPRHAPHPHRAPLRGGWARRRPGQLPAPAQPCLSPVGRPAAAVGRACAGYADAGKRRGLTGSDRAEDTHRVGSLESL
jgi:hypothetical protein